MEEPLREKQISTTVFLLREAQSGDRGAVESLIKRFQPFVERVISFLVGGPHVADIDDYAQECLWKAVRSLGTLEIDADVNFRAWLRAIARSVVLDESKRWKRLKRGGGRERPLADFGSDYLTSSILGASPGLSPSRGAAERELVDRVTAAVYELPPHHRELILMRTYCGLSYSEIAGRLGIENVESVRKSHQRALQSLRKRLPDGLV